MARRPIVHLAVLVTLLAGLPLAAGAFFFTSRPEVPLQLKEHEIVQGDYINVGDAVDLQGNVDGDVIVAGSRVTIAGAVSGDVIAAASEFTLTGKVEGDVRVAAVDVTIAGAVGKNLNVWASQVALQPTASIGRNAYVVAEELSTAGAVGRHLATRAARQQLSGTVGGDARLELGERGSALLLPDARVSGTLTYAGAHAGQLQREGTATSTVALRFEPLAAASAAERLRWYVFGRIVSLFGMMVVGLVLVTLAPRYVIALVQQRFIKQPWLALAWGLVAAVGTPLVAFVLAFTVIGLPLALIAAVIYLVALYLAQVVAGIAVGVWLFQRVSTGRYRGSLVAPMVVGLTLLVAATGFLGPAGWALKVVAVLWGFGALWQMKVEQLREWR